MANETGAGASTTAETILDHAAALFSTDGYQRTSMDDLARSVGMTKASLYHYFSSKSDVLFRIHTRGNEQTLESLEAANRLGRSPAERLELEIKAYFDYFVRNLNICRLLARSIDLRTEFRGEPEKLSAMIEQRKMITRCFESVIAEGMAAGEFEQGDPGLAAKMILGALNWTTTWYRPEGKLRPEEATAETVKLLTRIVARPGSGMVASGRQVSED